jgi:hypothetical protein
MKIKPINENIFGAAKRFSDAFFDGLKSNATNRMMDKAKKSGAPKELVDVMAKIQKDKDELDAILNRIANK